MGEAERLTKSPQYALVYGKGSSWATDFVVLKALANGLTMSRYGFSVSQRVGKAVTRNKVKRRLRQILRVMPFKSGWDIIFIARPAVAQADYTSLQRRVIELLSRARLLEVSTGKGGLAEVEAGSNREPWLHGERI